jgi:hypothetical protein
MSSTADRRTAWQEATIAWACCASIHREYAKGRDPLFTTRQADYVKHEQHAREMDQRDLHASPGSPDIVIVANDPGDVKDFLVGHLREQASIRRRQAALARIKTDARYYTGIANNLDFIANQLVRATIRGDDPDASI